MKSLILALLALDLGVFNRKAHVVSVKEALGWSADRCAGEVARVLTLLARRHRVVFDEPDLENHAQYAIG